jgi:hypothetical protein
MALLLPAAAHATGHNADWSGGFSRASGSTLWGVHSVFAGTMPKPNNPKNLSLLADFSLYHGSEDGRDQTLIGTMGGGRWTFAPRPHGGKQVETNQKVLPSVHALLGFMKTKGGDTDIASAVGGAVDIMLGDHRSSEAGLGVRVMVDYVVRHGDAHNLTRASVEMVWQFAKRH